MTLDERLSQELGRSLDPASLETSGPVTVASRLEAIARQWKYVSGPISMRPAVCYCGQCHRVWVAFLLPNMARRIVEEAWHCECGAHANLRTPPALVRVASF